ncbi:MAG: leucine-rich repeat domain-containing protein [Cyclobacteriaceae bacterium]
MVNVFLIISLLLFLAFLVGMIKPSIVIKSANASRGKVFLYYFLTSFICFIVVGYLGNKETDEALENPEGVTELRLTSKKYDDVPEFLSDFTDLKELSLKNNNISELAKTLLKLKQLEELDLSNNPLEEIPEWIIQLENLKKLDLDNTKIDTIPESVLAAIEDISFEGTPYKSIQEEQRQGAGTQSEGENSVEEGEEESFGDFALRKLMGKDYGYKKEFKEGELFYIKPITEVQVDSLGAYLENAGFFNDEKKVSMQITKNTRADPPRYELRAIVEEGGLDEDTRTAFKLQAMLISMGIFNNEPVDFHLCDEEFNTHTVLKSDE